MLKRQVSTSNMQLFAMGSIHYILCHGIFALFM